MDGRDQIARAIPEPEQLMQLISFSVGSELFGVEILVGPGNHYDVDHY